MGESGCVLVLAVLVQIVELFINSQFSVSCFNTLPLIHPNASSLHPSQVWHTADVCPDSSSDSHIEWNQHLQWFSIIDLRSALKESHWAVALNAFFHFCATLALHGKGRSPVCVGNGYCSLVNCNFFSERWHLLAISCGWTLCDFIASHEIFHLRDWTPVLRFLLQGVQRLSDAFLKQKQFSCYFIDLLMCSNLLYVCS